MPTRWIRNREPSPAYLAKIINTDLFRSPKITKLNCTHVHYYTRHQSFFSLIYRAFEPMHSAFVSIVAQQQLLSQSGWHCRFEIAAATVPNGQNRPPPQPSRGFVTTPRIFFCFLPKVEELTRIRYSFQPIWSEFYNSKFLRKQPPKSGSWSLRRLHKYSQLG